MPVVINGTTGISGVDGGAATPAYQGTDTNTGMFFPAADTIAFTTNGTEDMRIDSVGNVGIGTSSPVARLGVSLGTATSNGAPASWDSTYAVFGAAGSVSGSAVGLGFGSQGGVLTSLAPSNAWQTMNYLASSHVFYRVNAVEAMRLDASGNLGLGVTPSAWGSLAKAIQIGNRASVFTYNNTTTDVGYNAFFSSAINDYAYIASAAASFYRQTGGQHQFYTAPSGTAGNAISFTQAMTLDASGNLMVGATSNPNAYKIYARNNNTNTTSLTLENNNGGYQVYTSNQELAFFQLNVGERARIDSSGNLLVGKTTASDATQGVRIASNGLGVFARANADPLAVVRLDSNGDTVTFYRGPSGGTITQVGSISTTTTATAYNTSSDYRLKHDIAPMSGALAKVTSLKPVTYKWNVDDSEGEGFIAHELAEVCPQAVHGEKDAVDADGKPVYQGIDTSFLVATLTAAIQELKAELDTVKTELAALKGTA